MQWPENIVADRSERSGKWVLMYLTDEQVRKCNAALSEPLDCVGITGNLGKTSS